MVDIHSATAEVRRGIKKKKKKQDKNIMSASATQGGHKNINIYNIHKYSISNNMKKEKKQKRTLMTKHGIKDQLWQQKYQVN